MQWWWSLSKANRVGASVPLLCVELATIIIVGSVLTVWFAPEPFSDWLYYWNAAAEPSRYERGGVALLLVGVLKGAGWPPHLTMLLPNLAAAVAFVLMARAIDPLPGKWLSHLVAVYMFLLAPYVGLVQLDMLATAALVAGFCLATRAPARVPQWSVRVCAIAAFCIAVSTRPQFMLVLLVLAGLATLSWCAMDLRTGRRLPALVPLIVMGALGGFFLDSALRANAGRTGAIRTNSSVTLYAGLLASSTTFPRCGHWSSNATQVMRSDLGEGLADAVLKRLREKPARHWGAVVGCKVPHIVAPPAFAWGWLTASPNASVGWRKLKQWVAPVESWAYGGVVLLIYLVAGAAVIKSRSRGSTSLVPILWIVAFWGVHLIFEVQGRYFLGLLATVPFLSALALRPPERGQPTS